MREDVRRATTSRRLLIVALSLTLMLAAVVPAGADVATTNQPDTIVLDWNRYAAEALINAPTAAVPGAGQTPPVAVLHLAMVQGAVFDAVNMIDGSYEPYLDGLPPAPSGASKPAAVATAAHHVLVGLGIAPVPPLATGVVERLDALYAEDLAAIPDGSAKTAGVEAGAAAAAAMLAERTDDGRYTAFSFTTGTGIGDWRPTSGVNDPFGWVAIVDPFAINTQSQFRTAGPLAISSRAYAKEYNEVKDFGGNGTTTPTLRTPEQTATALFFTANPIELYNRTFRTIAQNEALSLVSQARLFVALNVSGADAIIGCWDDKEFWSVWRPITAIQQGEFDGNSRTVGDPTWNSLVPSPPYPDHPSGYNCVTGAFMHAAKNVFGTNNVSFDLVKITPGQPDVVRSYQRFTDVVTDTINARIWLGIHFRTPDEQGAKLGQETADWISRGFFGRS